jgi:2',3'-cyclic-nucleotide 2'-phosphodiesterase (5'-nucleotidase family)
MKPLDWNIQKNVLLKLSRGIGFEDVVNAITDGHLHDTLQHPNSKKYANQKVYIVELYGYAYSVPFVENTEVCFLKTIYPSRKYTKQYLSKKE